MGTIKINQDVNVLLRNLLKEYIAHQESIKNPTEDTIDQKGHNAIVILEIKKAERIIS